MATCGIIMLAEIVLSGTLLQPTTSYDNGVFGIFFVFFNSFLIIIAISKEIDRFEEKYAQSILLISFFLHLIILFWDIYARDIYVLPNAEGDAVAYHNVAVSYAFGGRSGVTNLTDYSFYIGIMYRMIGANRIVPQFINIYFAMYSIVLAIKIMEMIGLSYETKKNATIIISFLPNLLIISSVLLQESIIAFCIMTAIFYYTKWWFDRKSIYFILSIIFSIIGSFLHIGGVVVAIGAVISYPFVGKRSRILKISLPKVVVSVAFAFLILIVISRFGQPLLGKIGGAISADSIVLSAGKTDRVSDADYLTGSTNMSSTASLIVYTPIRMLYFICSPLPWMWRGLGDIIAFFGSALFYIITVIKVWKAYRLSDDSDSVKAFMFVIIVALLISAVIFGWGVSNTGTALRHREKFTYTCIVLYAVAQELINRHRCEV